MPLRTELSAVKEGLRVAVEKVRLEVMESREVKATSDGELLGIIRIAQKKSQKARKAA